MWNLILKEVFYLLSRKQIVTNIFVDSSVERKPAPEQNESSFNLSENSTGIFKIEGIYIVESFFPKSLFVFSLTVLEFNLHVLHTQTDSDTLQIIIICIYIQHFLPDKNELKRN